MVSLIQKQTKERGIGQLDILLCEHLSKSFGGVKAVDDVTFHLEEGKVTGLIGGNGAGKTTLFNLLTGFLPADGGGIFFHPGQKQEIALYHKHPHEYAHLGIARTFQNLRLFETLSVKEHLILAKHVCKSQVEIPKLLEQLEISRLAERDANLLSYGDKRRVEIGRAIATGAKILFLDEPCAGLNEKESRGLSVILKNVKTEYSLTICVIEHNMEFIRSLCDRVYAMDSGKILFEGKTEEVLNHPSVRRAVFGEDL